MMPHILRITFSYLVIGSLVFLIKSQHHYRSPNSFIEKEIGLINGIISGIADGLFTTSSKCANSLKSIPKRLEVGDEAAIKGEFETHSFTFFPNY